MSAQTGKVPEKVSYDTGQQTPVIIKNGDGIAGSSEVAVTIGSDFMYFTEWVQRTTTWESQSTLTGRIHELSFVEGTQPEPQDTLQPFPEELSSIRIECGPDHFLVVRESGDTAGGDVVLVIESTVPFDVDKPGNWKHATAMLPAITGVVFLGGNERLVKHEFTNPDVRVCVHFHRNKK